MVNRKEGLFVEKPLHDDKKEPKRGLLRRAAKAARTAEREEREAETAARVERAERAEAAPTGHKKPDGRTRMVRSVRNPFRQ